MKEAIIKISFTVLPDGQVGEMIPTIKSDATLEKITLDALRPVGVQSFAVF